MLTAVYRALRPNGRFVAECGGDVCVHTIVATPVRALERAGFRIDRIALISRPTPFPGDIIGWLETFGQSLLHGRSDLDRLEYLHEVCSILEPQLHDGNGTWVADYVRLRFAATKPVHKSIAHRHGA